MVLKKHRRAVFLELPVGPSKYLKKKFRSNLTGSRIETANQLAIFKV